MAVIDQVSQFLPCQSVYRNKGFLEVCAVYENLDFYCFSGILGMMTGLEYNYMRKYFHLLLSL